MLHTIDSDSSDSKTPVSYTHLLILFVGAVANAIIFWSDGWLCLSVFAILPFILFIWLVKRHNFWFYRKDFLKKKIEINEQELRAMQYDFSDFDDGKEFINPSHLYTLDLDVFGEHSLFLSLIHIYS